MTLLAVRRPSALRLHIGAMAAPPSGEDERRPDMNVDHVGTSPQKRRAGDVAPSEVGQPLTLDLIREAIRGEIKTAVGGFREDVQAVVARVDNVESQVTSKMQQTINLLEDMTGKYITSNKTS